MTFIQRNRGALAMVCLTAGLLTHMALASPSDSELLTRAQALYAEHNYAQAAELCEKVLAGSPGESDLRSAQRVKALSLCMLRGREGYEYAEKIIADHEPFGRDPELRRAMGDDRFNRSDRKRAYAYYIKAADLFEAAGDLTQAAKALLRAAESLRHSYDVLPAHLAAKTWPERQRITIDRMAEIYDRIVALKVDDALRVEALLSSGRALRRDGSWAYAQKAIVVLTRVTAEFPASAEAVYAQYDIGQTYERFDKFVASVESYRKVITDFDDKQLAEKAKGRIDSISAPQVSVAALKPHLPGDEAKLYWRIRNVKRLSLIAYSIDLPAAVNSLTWATPSIETLGRYAAANGRAVATWNFTTPDEGKYQYHQHLPESESPQTTRPIGLPFSSAGAYMIKAVGVNPDNQSAANWSLVIVSNIAAVAKTDGDQVLVMVSQAGDGEPVGDADVSVSRYRTRDERIDRARGRTNDAGIAQIKLPAQRRFGWIAAVKKGEHQAIIAENRFRWRWWGYRQKHMVYGFTERPVYRPGQTVSFKQIIRAHKEGAYKNLPDAKVKVEIRNPRGEQVYAKQHITDEFGAVEGAYVLKDDAPLGVYSITVHVNDEKIGQWQSKGNRFRVEEYKKPEFKVTVESAKPDYRVGDDMKIKIAAKYYYGEPVVNAEVSYRIRKQSYVHRYQPSRPWEWYHTSLRGYGRYRPWWHPRFDELVTTGTVKTDANGEAFVSVKAQPIKDHEELDLKFIVSAEVTDSSRRMIRGGGEVKVTHAPFFIYPTPAQRVYGPGDSVEINVKTENPNGQPVAGTFEVNAWRVKRIRKVVKDEDGKERVEFEERLEQHIHSGQVEVSKNGRASYRFTPDVTGHVKIVVKQAATEEGKSPVEGSCDLWIASKTGVEEHYAYNDLQIVPSSDQYEIGQTMRVLVNTAKSNSYVLLTGEADTLLFWQVVHVAGNSKLVEIPIAENLTPNFKLTATLLRDNMVYRDTKDIIVPPTHKYLKVDVETIPADCCKHSDTFQPRAKAKVRIKLTDMRTGKPIVGQTAVMLVDSSVYYIQPEFREAIEKAFYGHVRRVMVSTADSFAGPQSINGHRFGQPGMGVRSGIGGLEFSRLRSIKSSGLTMELADAAAPQAAMESQKTELAETIVRAEFRDTVLWAGSVVTDADGTAEIPFTLPDQLTSFALHVIAFDKQTRVGQATAEVVTKKNIIVRLESGRFFTEGDHSYVTVIAHNYFDEPTDLQVDLSASDALELRQVKLNGKWRDYTSGEALGVTVPAGGEVRLDFRTTAVRAGEVEMLARARGVKESDAIKLTKPIVPWGARKIVSSGGVLSGDDGTQAASWEIEVPDDIKRNSQLLTVTLNPSIAAVAMDSLPFLARYPYGCVEQTMSRFMPTVLVRKTLTDAGISLDDVRKHVEQLSASDEKLAAKYALVRKRMGRNPVYSSAEVDTMVAKGIKRLTDMQHSDGGWGWWKHGASDPYMTAYVTYGLVVARRCDVDLPAGMLERAGKFLTDWVSRPKRPEEKRWHWRHMDNDNTRAYAMFVIGEMDRKQLTRPKLAAELKRIYDARDDLTDYGRAYLAMTLHAAGDVDEAKIVVENFANTVTVDAKTNTAHWGSTAGWRYWYRGATETTAWVIQAMMTVSPDEKHISMAVNWLVRNRREFGWHNTKATATVAMALMRYAKTSGELDCDQTFEIAIDGQYRRTVRVTRENLFSFDNRIVIDASSLPPGKHSVSISRSGRGSLYWGGHLRYFDTAEEIKAGGNELAITRKYYRLVGEEFTNTRTVWKDGKAVKEQFKDFREKREELLDGAEIASGDQIEVELSITADYNFEYMVFEDAKPSGCEPYRLTSGGSYGGGMYANIELRDTKVAFFASYFPKGERKLTYRLICEQPGTFRVLPAAGEAMYSPFVEAISDSDKLTIVE